MVKERTRFMFPYLLIFFFKKYQSIYLLWGETDWKKKNEPAGAEGPGTGSACSKLFLFSSSDIGVGLYTGISGVGMNIFGLGSTLALRLSSVHSEGKHRIWSI